MFFHYFFWSGLARVMRKVAVGIFFHSFHYNIVTALVQQLSVAFSRSWWTVAHFQWVVSAGKVWCLWFVADKNLTPMALQTIKAWKPQIARQAKTKRTSFLRFDFLLRARKQRVFLKLERSKHFNLACTINEVLRKWNKSGSICTFVWCWLAHREP